MIIPDCPFEERGEFEGSAAKYGMDFISMIAPTSEDRIKTIASQAKGFIYVVSSLGVTGVRSEITTDLDSIIKLIKEATDTPAAIGFGISTPAQAAEMSKKADGVIAWLVPGSWAVDRQIREEGLDKVLEAAGFEIRQPGCSACLAMNDDKVPAGKYCVSTSNRNFEGRQGPGSRTILCSPLVAAAAAVTGVITDPRELL
ncbi:MAG: tryptophan synthase subunit alpha [Prevotella sp.]|nr:tryptophan synthase subunit alpha [Prevotella sp.]